MSIVLIFLGFAVGVLVGCLRSKRSYDSTSGEGINLQSTKGDTMSTETILAELATINNRIDILSSTITKFLDTYATPAVSAGSTVDLSGIATAAQLSDVKSGLDKLLSYVGTPGEAEAAVKAAEAPVEHAPEAK